MRMANLWTVAIGLAAVLGASDAVAGGATTTTSSSTTTTTLFGGCEVAPTFDSILCRLDALVATIQNATDLGRPKQSVLGTATLARKQGAKAQQAGTGKVATNQLKKCAKTLDKVRHKLDSLTAKRFIPQGTRDFLRSTASSIRDDVNTLRGTL